MEGRAKGGSLSDERVIKALLAGGYLTEEDAGRVTEQSKNKLGTAASIVLREQLVTKDVLGQAVAESYGVEYADLNSNQPAKEQILKVPDEIAKKYRVVLYSEDGAGAVFTTDDPQASGLSEALQQVFPSLQRATLAYSLQIGRAHV